MEDEESEFSFKDLFFYCVKKWFVILVAAILGMGLGFGIAALKSTDEESYRVSAVFCSLEVFRENYEPIDTEGITIEFEYPKLYDSATSEFRRIMTGTDGIAEFVETDAFKTNVAVAFPNAKIDTPKDRQVLFNQNFEMVASGNAFNVGISGEFNTDEKRVAAKNLIKGYAEFATERVYDSNAKLRDYINGNEKGAITVSAPIYFLTANDLEKDGGLIKTALIGLAIGFVVGIIIAVVIYMVDPRVKSLACVNTGGELIAKVKQDELKREAVLRIAGKTKDDKMLLIASPEYDGFTDALAKAVSHEFAAAGLKTLYVDFSGGSEGGEISDFYSGKAVSEVVTKADGFDSVGSKNRANIAALMSKKEKFATLKDEYDKVVVSYSDNSDGGAVALGDVSDKVLYVINQKSVKLKNFQALITDIDKKEAELGTYVHNSI